MLSQIVNGLERRLVLTPAWHKVNDDPSKNYGVHGMEMRFYVIGDKGAVQYVEFTGMMLPETWKWWKDRGQPMEMYKMHMGADVGYHSKVPMYEGHEPMGSKKREGTETLKLGDKELEVPKFVDSGTFDPCEFTGGGPCYYDGSGMLADTYEQVLLREGDDKIWEMLEQEYHERFDQKETA